MSKLSNLIKFKHDLLELSRSLTIDTEINKQITTVTELQNKYPNVYDISSISNKLSAISHRLSVENTTIIDKILQIIKNLDLQILEIYNSSAHQQNFMKNSITYNFIPKRRAIPKDIKKNIVASMRNYCVWKYPTLIVNPVDKGLIDSAVASDPLYLTYHSNYKTISQLISKFPESYQSRLRIYELTDYDFSAFPQGQFSTIVNYNIINIFNITELKNYLNKLFNLLRPGGVVLANLYLVTSGDNDEWAFFEQIAIGTIISICRQLGFNLSTEDIKIQKFECNKNVQFDYVCWITMHKPGELTTVKAHQALTEIIPK
jgi:hypothetical protein